VINIIFNDKVIARGLTNYPSEELGKIKGHKTSEMIKALGYEGDKEVINRDNMVVL
jgi:glutamate 5-kinase